MTSQLVGSDYSDGALLPNYVNGRLLVAEDLATSQATLRTRDQWVAEAAGAGVVHGLWVTGLGTTITVGAGLAISAAGEPVVVSRQVTLEMASTAPTASQRTDALFSCCDQNPPGQQPSPQPTTGSVVLLVARAACQLQGQAPLAPPPSTTVSPGCTAQWLGRGVEFRTITLPIPDEVVGIPVTDTTRRNLVAHWLLGTEQLRLQPLFPFIFDPAYSGFDQLDPADLTPYDAPLAVFAWSGSTIGDVDNWSARRRVTQPDPVPGPWSAVVSDRRAAEGQARWLQFQDEAADLVAAGQALSTYAGDYFPLLPPVGFLPVDASAIEDIATDAQNAMLMVDHAGAKEPNAADQLLAQMSAAEVPPGVGYNPRVFFGSERTFGGVIEWSEADFVLRQSWRAAPMQPSDDEGTSRPRFTYYVVLDNLLALIQGKIGITQLKTGHGAFGAMKPPPGPFPTKVGGQVPAVYLVFVANQFWYQQNKTPFVAFPPGRSVDDG